MPSSDPITPHDIQVAITLASITYLDESRSLAHKRATFMQYLAYPDLPTGGHWQLVWGPAEHETNLWYVVADAAGSRVALVIRGTKMDDPISLWEDADLTMVPPPIAGAPADATIANGFATALERLAGAVDPTTKQDGWTFLGDYLAANPAATIDVVGHSLGGALAPLVALDAQDRFPDHSVRAFPFGGQSPGNHTLAHWYDQSFPDQPTRFANELDIIPFWYAGFDHVRAGFPGGPGCPELISLALEATEEYLRLRGFLYEASPRPARFPGRIYPDSSQLFAWPHQASAQHEHLYYMYLTGVPLHVIQARFDGSWSPPPEPEER